MERKKNLSPTPVSPLENPLVGSTNDRNQVSQLQETDPLISKPKETKIGKSPERDAHQELPASIAAEWQDWKGPNPITGAGTTLIAIKADLAQQEQKEINWRVKRVDTSNYIRRGLQFLGVREIDFEYVREEVKDKFLLKLDDNVASWQYASGNRVDVIYKPETSSVFRNQWKKLYYSFRGGDFLTVFSCHAKQFTTYLNESYRLTIEAERIAHKKKWPQCTKPSTVMAYLQRFENLRIGEPKGSNQPGQSLLPGIDQDSLMKGRAFETRCRVPYLVEWLQYRFDHAKELENYGRLPEKTFGALCEAFDAENFGAYLLLDFAMWEAKNSLLQMFEDQGKEIKKESDMDKVLKMHDYSAEEVKKIFKIFDRNTAQNPLTEDQQFHLQQFRECGEWLYRVEKDLREKGAHSRYWKTTEAPQESGSHQESDDSEGKE